MSPVRVKRTIPKLKVINSKRVISSAPVVTIVRVINPVKAVTSSVKVISPVRAVTSSVKVVTSPAISSVILNLKLQMNRTLMPKVQL